MLKEPVLYHSYFNQHSEILDGFEDNLSARNLTHYASQLLSGGLHDEHELETALKKAITAITAATLPASKHVRKVYICSKGQLREDWLVSDLVFQLIILNADASNPVVAKLQIDILSNGH